MLKDPIKTKKNSFQTNPDPQQSVGPSALNKTVVDFARPGKEISAKREPITYKIEINENFKSTEIAGWKIWINNKGRIICAPVDRKDQTRHYRTFGYEEGTIFVVTDASDRHNNTSIVYFRTKTFQEFLIRYNITNILNLDPNGYYRGQCADIDGTTYTVYITANGPSVSIQNNDGMTPFRSSLPTIINDRHANMYYTVSGATITVFDRIVKHVDGQCNRYRTVITKLHVLEYEETIRDIIESLDAEESYIMEYKPGE